MPTASQILHSRSGFRWLLAPFLILLIVFWLMPLIHGAFMSLEVDFPREGKTYGPFANYERLTKDRFYKKAAVNTAKFASATILTIIPLSVFLAFILTRLHRRLRYFSLFCLIIPGLIPPAILGLLFNMTFSGQAGLLNQLFVIPFGGTPVHWMSDPDFIMPSMVIQAVWRWTGFITLFILCGLEAIPNAVKEAATLEGAGVFRKFFSIELPAVKHLMIFCAAFLFIDTFALFQGAYSLLGPSGGTANAGLIMVNYTYKMAMANKFNMAATVCISMLPVLMLLTGFFCLKWGRKK